MASINVVADVDLDEPVLVEGLPGVGLVGKIATDHIVQQFEMQYYAGVDCEGIPRVAVYDDGERMVRPPVRIYVDEERDLLALQSDVPVSRTAATDFADCVTGWLREQGVTPVYLSGLPAEQDVEEVPDVYGVGTSEDAGERLDELGVDRPPERGIVSGPTGALLNRAADTGSTAVGLVVECDPQFPDPAASRQLITRGIDPLADVEVDTEDLVESAEEIRDQKQQLAQRMQQAGEEESSQARTVRMFQ